MKVRYGNQKGARLSTKQCAVILLVALPVAILSVVLGLNGLLSGILTGIAIFIGYAVSMIFGKKLNANESR